MFRAILTSLENLFRKPATVPVKDLPAAPPNYRGLIVQDPDKCISCRRCEQNCPPGAIAFSQAEDGAQTYHYSPYVCIYCGECVRICPKDGALIQSNEPAKPAVSADDPNHGWNETARNAKESRERYAAAKKAKAAKPKPETT